MKYFSLATFLSVLAALVVFFIVYHMAFTKVTYAVGADGKVSETPSGVLSFKLGGLPEKKTA